jgi:hypothetical protein
MSFILPKAAGRLLWLLALVGGPAAAQHVAPAAPAPQAQALAPLPRAFAGYAQPSIPASACRVVNATGATCQIPAMTAGRYLIEAAGTSTAQGAGAEQELQIVVGGQVCGAAQNTQAWSSGPRTFRFDCAATLLTDRPVNVVVIYADKNAVKDPKGPTLAVRPVGWNGVLTTLPFAPRQ